MQKQIELYQYEHSRRKTLVAHTHSFSVHTSQTEKLNTSRADQQILPFNRAPCVRHKQPTRHRTEPHDDDDDQTQKFNIFYTRERASEQASRAYRAQSAAVAVCCARTLAAQHTLQFHAACPRIYTHTEASAHFAQRCIYTHTYTLSISIKKIKSKLYTLHVYYTENSRGHARFTCYGKRSWVLCVCVCVSAHVHASKFHPFAVA